jgi:hypothetical protein
LENGHEDFEHPSYKFRGNKRPFDANMDHFSSHIIYLSLLAVAEHPELWEKFHVERKLLFQGEADLRNPDASALFATLKDAPNPRIALLARYVAAYASAPASVVPSLEATLRKVDSALLQARKAAAAAEPDTAEESVGGSAPTGAPAPEHRAPSPDNTVGGPLGSARKVQMRGFGPPAQNGP